MGLPFHEDCRYHSHLLLAFPRQQWFPLLSFPQKGEREGEPHFRNPIHLNGWQNEGEPHSYKSKLSVAHNRNPTSLEVDNRPQATWFFVREPRSATLSLDF
jgi:hypothetical protein